MMVLPSPVRMTLPCASRPILTERSVSIRAAGGWPGSMRRSVSASMACSGTDAGNCLKTVPVAPEPSAGGRQVRGELRGLIGEVGGALGVHDRPLDGAADLVLVGRRLVQLVLGVIQRPDDLRRVVGAQRGQQLPQRLHLHAHVYALGGRQLSCGTGGGDDVAVAGDDAVAGRVTTDMN